MYYLLQYICKEKYIKHESEVSNMGENERIVELVEILEKVCGLHGNDCSKCSKKAECEEYCKLSNIDKIV